MSKDVFFHLVKPNNTSIFSYYIKKMLIYVVLPLLIITVIFLYIINKINLQSQTDTKYEFYVEKLPEQITDVVNSIYSTQNILLSSTEMKDYFYTEYTDNNALAVTASQISNSLNNICLSSSCIESIYIYNKQTDYVLSNSFNSSVENFPDISWIKSNINNISYRTPIIDNEERHFLTFSTNLTMHNFPEGMIVYNIDCDNLSDILYFSTNFIKNFYLIDNYGNIIYSTDTNAINTNFENYSSMKNMVLCPAETLFDIAFQYNIDDNLTNSYSAILIVYTIIIFIIIFISNSILSNSFSMTLIELISMLENNDINSSGNPKSQFRHLIKNSLSARKQNSIYEKEIIAQYNKLKKAQTMILQNQSNPHFLFNTLNVITLLDAEQNDGNPTEITSIIKTLSDLLRATIDSKTYLIDLEQEIIFVEKYIKLQNIKYDNMITFSTSIAPETEEMTVLKFMLQPIVENSIIHGILKTPEPHKGFIKIKSYLSGNDLIIEITNSGSHIDEKTLSDINEKLENDVYPETQHIGLLNVNSRIKLIFGKQYSCRLLYSENIATVRLTLPSDFEKDV